MCGSSPYRRVVLAKEAGEKSVMFTCITARDVNIMEEEGFEVTIMGEVKQFGSTKFCNDVIVNIV